MSNYFDLNFVEQNRFRSNVQSTSVEKNLIKRKKNFVNIKKVEKTEKE
jgi:hypothetical protein